MHSNVAGPMNVATFGQRHLYAINFKDDYSGLLKVYTMPSKDDVLTYLKMYIAEVGKPKTLHSDNGGEYISKKFRAYCIENEIKQTFIIPYNSQQNGKAECAWLTIFNDARTLLADAQLGKHWWGMALLYAVYTRNHTLSGNDLKTHHEIFYGKSVDVSTLRPFSTIGTTCSLITLGMLLLAGC